LALFISLNVTSRPLLHYRMRVPPKANTGIR
jgi:hypothetical protein